MERLGDGLKKIILAGIGAAATTVEKSRDIVDDMVKKGELTVEQGKVLNQELKHNIKETVKEKVNVSMKPSTPEEMNEMLTNMSAEELADLKEKLEAAEAMKKAEAEEAAADVASDAMDEEGVNE